ncbi:Glycosyltransferase involved in cell wall bisynthesis [Desulfacinum infernum DSM 9756]|uniref:Glycosyltransferase involved in cell wall bisynthesis n=1 Tax=Desulfacinum infernum DSM 9756 TaxID=1121391 RepID=A0A1M5CSY7_9BACT|nr:glycosyltransferase family 4 protein [Desulfacinum infernum]SHF57757.1 Glycosyltransferase involved in cell wall bisynthesis [Desulfacinum infernum DSM 9756]
MDSTRGLGITRKNVSQPAVWLPTIRAGSGTDVFTERLVEGLRRRGIRAEITWLPLRAEYAPWTVPVPKPPNWANIVHINSWLHPRFVPRNLPTVVTVHHSVHDPAFMPYKTLPQKIYHRFWIRPIEARNLERAAVVTAVSRHVAAQVKKLFGRTDVVVVYNGIDVENTFTPGSEREPHRPFRLLYVGNWVKRKGVDLLGPILETLGPDFELVYTADRSGAHTQYPLPPNCRCIGRLAPHDLARTYRNADALLFPSRSEGLPLTIIEAMACGLSPVASNIPAVASIVQNGVTGLLCTPNDIRAFERAVRSLSTERKAWLAMRLAAREHALREFSITEQTRAYFHLYLRSIPWNERFGIRDSLRTTDCSSLSEPWAER